jgi:hypothetical protein
LESSLQKKFSASSYNLKEDWNPFDRKQTQVDQRMSLLATKNKVRLEGQVVSRLKTSTVGFTDDKVKLQPLRMKTETDEPRANHKSITVKRSMESISSQEKQAPYKDPKSKTGLSFTKKLDVHVKGVLSKKNLQKLRNQSKSSGKLDRKNNNQAAQDEYQMNAQTNSHSRKSIENKANDRISIKSLESQYGISK